MAVNIGVRPEDMVTAPEGGEYIYEGRVNITEALGEVTLLYYETETPDGVPVIGKLAGIHGDLRGDVVRMTADPSKVHVFHEGRLAPLPRRRRARAPGGRAAPRGRLIRGRRPTAGGCAFPRGPARAMRAPRSRRRAPWRSARP